MVERSSRCASSWHTRRHGHGTRRNHRRRRHGRRSTPTRWPRWPVCRSMPSPIRTSRTHSAVRDRLGAAVVDDPFELIASADIDGLVIASPDDTHADFAIAAVRPGPPDPVREAARHQRRRRLAGGRRRGRGRTPTGPTRVHARVRPGPSAGPGGDCADLGDVDYVRAVHRNANRVRRPLDQIVGQSMVHDIHTLRHLTGAEIVWVRASGSGAVRRLVPPHRRLCASSSSGGHAVLEFDDGGFAYEVSVEVLTTDGDVITGAPTAARPPPQRLDRRPPRHRLVRLVRRRLPDPGPGLGRVDPGRDRRPARRPGTALRRKPSSMRSSSRSSHGRRSPSATPRPADACTPDGQRSGARRTRRVVVTRRGFDVGAQVRPRLLGRSTRGARHDERTVETFSLRGPHGLDPKQPAVEAAHVVLAVVERGPPSSPFEVATGGRLQHGAVLAGTGQWAEDARCHRDHCERASLWNVTPENV